MTSSVVADLHLHSPYSRAVSKFMTIPEMSRQAHRRGIDLLATGDWTHPEWFKTLQTELEEWQPGIYLSKQNPTGAKFLLSTEISCIYSQKGKVYRVHLLVFAPSLSVVEKINQALLARGCNLHADGRPVIGLSCEELAKIVFAQDDKCLVIPAHAWTPWFGVYGSKGGFDTLQEAFGTVTDQIYAIETGLSSDPLMNWRIEELERRAIVSFSDAHSPAKMGREATVFAFKDDAETYAYEDVFQAITERSRQENSGRLKLDYTIEFYPEEGKYHWDGHRGCGVVQKPEVTIANGKTCPVCGRELTIGVEYRVNEVAKIPLKTIAVADKMSEQDLKFHYHSDPTRPPFVNLVPLQEIISEVLDKGVGSKVVVREYERVLNGLGREFEILMHVPEEKVRSVAGPTLTAAIMKVRRGEVKIEPGYDGVYGKVEIPGLEEDVAREPLQESLF